MEWDNWMGILYDHRLWDKYINFERLPFPMAQKLWHALTHAHIQTCVYMIWVQWRTMPFKSVCLPYIKEMIQHSVCFHRMFHTIRMYYDRFWIFFILSNHMLLYENCFGQSTLYRRLCFVFFFFYLQFWCFNIFERGPTA